MLNLSPLFYTTVENDNCLHRTLDMSPPERDGISDARKEIRDCLRNGIPNELKLLGYSSNLPRPRFFTQGSWAYKTLNVPAQHPQQADLDDGCYLPMSFVQEEQRPSIATAEFFRASEKALASLVAKKGWRLDTSKATCIRVEISQRAHIDIPLYAIPDAEFEKLSVEAMKSGFALDEAVSFSQADRWFALPSDKVLLAHRENDWMASDPRKIKDWFLGEVAAKGEQYRRIVRYLKAFRDWRWSSGGPSSVLLMAAAAHLFNKDDRRDDLALQYVVGRLPARLRAGVLNPTDDSESFTDRLGIDGVEEAAKEFERLGETIRAAMGTLPQQACDRMREAFGSRFPNEPERVLQIPISEDQSEDESHVLPPPWPVNNWGKISIIATVHAPEKGDNLGSYQSDGVALPKNRWLSFKAEHLFDDNVMIRWQIVNTGREARISKGLRGGFDEKKGHEIWEHTQYKGRHWVECFAVKKKPEVCLGRSGKFYVNIS
jgi:hypothetical protein